MERNDDGSEQLFDAFSVIGSSLLMGGGLSLPWKDPSQWRAKDHILLSMMLQAYCAHMQGRPRINTPWSGMAPWAPMSSMMMPGMVMQNGFDDVYQRLAKLEQIVKSYEDYKDVLFGSEQDRLADQYRKRLTRMWQEIQSGSLPGYGGHNHLNGFHAPGGMSPLHPMYMPPMAGTANPSPGYGNMMPNYYSNMMRDRRPMWDERNRGFDDMYGDEDGYSGDGAY